MSNSTSFSPSVYRGGELQALPLSMTSFAVDQMMFRRGSANPDSCAIERRWGVEGKFTPWGDNGKTWRVDIDIKTSPAGGQSGFLGHCALSAVFQIKGEEVGEIEAICAKAGMAQVLCGCARMKIIEAFQSYQASRGQDAFTETLPVLPILDAESFLSAGDREKLRAFAQEQAKKQEV